MSQVIVYNAGGQQELHRVSLRHAIRMLHRRVARVLDVVDGQTFGPYDMPRSVELVRYVFTHWAYKRTGKVEYSKANVLRRDRYRCAYCDRAATTIDHIVPKAHDGPSTWLNTVAACEKCNWEKSDRTPEQADMRLRITPYVPTAEDIYPASARTTKRLRAVMAMADSRQTVSAA